MKRKLKKINKQNVKFMRKLTFLLTCLFLVGVGLVNAQSKSVSGKVFSADDGQPIIGATVRVQGTTVGTITDADGNFKINLPASEKKLVFSYVGMKTVDVVAQNNMLVKMQSDSKMIDEVVVTAMGISKSKKSLGYASQDVKAGELTQGASSDLASALQGKLSGVAITPSSGMPGASSQITIRGSRSFTGDNTPLYVIDGMPVSSTSDISTGNSVTGSDYANRAIDIDPNDIESVNVLKGQAASALYGMRASNGVIIITTKKGNNARSSKPEVSINSSMAFQTIAAFPDLQTEFAQGSSGKYSPTASTSWGPVISELANSTTYGGNTDNAYTKTSTGAYVHHPGQYYVTQRANAGLDPWAYPQVYNSAKDFFQTGTSLNNSVNVSQSLQKGNYSVTLGSSNSKGIIPSTGMDRYNAKIAADTKLTDKWSSGFSGNIISSSIKKQSSANNGVVATVYPTPPSYDLAGIPAYYAGNPYKQNTYRSTGGFDAAYWAIDNNKFTEDLQRFFGNAYIKYSTKISENQKLEVKYQLGDDAYNTNYTDLWGFGHANSTGEISNYDYAVNELNSLLTVTYNWKINNDWNVDALLGNEIVDRNTKYTYAYGKNFNYGGWNHIDNTSTFIASSSTTGFRSVGTFGNLSADYKNMLYLNATLRSDIISSMPRGNRTFTYPSVSLGWVFTELNSLKSEVLTYGKLRASYANVGQAGTYHDTYYSTPVYGGGFSSGTPIAYPIGSTVAYTYSSTVYDPNLKPQNTVNYEVGTDLTFFNGLVSLNYTYSRQNVKDQIFSVPLAGSTGAQYLVTNGGSIHTNSHEVTLGLKPIDKKNIKWDLAFNFTKIDNFVDALATGVNSIFLGGFTEPQVRAGIGYKFPVIYGVSYLRNDAGQIVVDANGLPQAGPEKVIGTVSPKFTLGFNTSFEVFKFRLSAVLDWKNGGQMYSGTAGLLDYYGISQKSADFRKQGSFLFELPAVKEAGLDVNGKMTYATNDITIKGSNAQTYFSTMNGISESMIYDASFVKLREISLSYPIFSKSWLTINASVFARNIIIWSALKGLDPEASQGNTNMVGAFERFSLPGTSTYGFGFNVKF